MVINEAVKTSKVFPIPDKYKAWVLDDPGELRLTEKPMMAPGKAEVLVRIDAISVCGTDLEIMYKGLPAMIEGGMPFNKNFTPGHEYMGTVVALGPGVDEYSIGDRVTVEIHVVRECIPLAITMERTMATKIKDIVPMVFLQTEGFVSMQ